MRAVGGKLQSQHISLLRVDVALQVFQHLNPLLSGDDIGKGRQLKDCGLHQHAAKIPAVQRTYGVEQRKVSTLNFPILGLQSIPTSSWSHGFGGSVSSDPCIIEKWIAVQ